MCPSLVLKTAYSPGFNAGGFCATAKVAIEIKRAPHFILRRLSLKLPGSRRLLTARPANPALEWKHPYALCLGPFDDLQPRRLFPPRRRAKARSGARTP